MWLTYPAYVLWDDQVGMVGVSGVHVMWHGLTNLTEPFKILAQPYWEEYLDRGQGTVDPVFWHAWV